MAGDSSQESREMAVALNRWDEEGGASGGLWFLPYEPGTLKDEERRLLECLGAALVDEWTDLATDIQRRLFERATTGKPVGSEFRARVAQFLHDRNDVSSRH
jgi:hypothetical protein